MLIFLKPGFVFNSGMCVCKYILQVCHYSIWSIDVSYEFWWIWGWTKEHTKQHKMLQLNIPYLLVFHYFTRIWSSQSCVSLQENQSLQKTCEPDCVHYKAVHWHKLMFLHAFFQNSCSGICTKDYFSLYPTFDMSEMWMWLRFCFLFNSGFPIKQLQDHPNVFHLHLHFVYPQSFIGWNWSCGIKQSASFWRHL